MDKNVLIKPGITHPSVRVILFDTILSSNILTLIYFGLLVLIIHGNAIMFGFAREDILILKFLSEWSFWDKVFGYWRPVWCLWLSIQYSVFGLNPRAMHVMSLVLCTINCWLAFYILTVIGIKKSVAMVTVFLWTLLAGNVYASVWISECNDLLALFFLLLASLIWIKYCLKSQPSFKFVFLACICWLLSIMTKEVGMLWPVGVVVLNTLKLNYFEKGSGKSVKYYLLMSVPFIFMLFYIFLKILAQGSSAGLNLDEYASQERVIYDYPLFLKFIKMLIHYFEGIVYCFLPLELFLSWESLIFGVTGGICLIFCLIVLNKNWFNSNALQLCIGLFWSLIFSIHTSFNVSARTLYIATLGVAFVMSLLLFSIKTKKLCYITLVFLSIYIGTHVFLGKKVTEYFSPSSPDMISCSIRLLDSPKLSEDKKAYLKEELYYLDIDLMADYHECMFVDKGPWKKVKKGLFQRFIIQRFIDVNEQ